MNLKWHTPERKIQEAYCEYLHIRKIPYYAIPNGGFRLDREAVSLKRQGVAAGVPDICVPVARGKFHGLYVEIKSEHGKLSERQIEWCDLLRQLDYHVLVGYGLDECIGQTERYFELPRAMLVFEKIMEDQA